MNRMEFLARVMDMLNVSDTVMVSLDEVFTVICEYLGAEYGFCYEADPGGTYKMSGGYTSGERKLPAELKVSDALAEALFNQVQEKKYIFFQDPAQDGIERELAELYGVTAMLLLPVKGHQDSLQAFVGVADIADKREIQGDLVHAGYAVLYAVVNYLKTRWWQQRTEATQNVLQNIVDNMGVDIYVNDFYSHEILYTNASMAAPYGGIDNLLGKVCWQALYDDRTEECEYCPQHKLIDESGNPTKIYTWDYKRPFDGSWFRVLSTAFRWIDGRLAHLVSSVNITESKRNESIIRKIASVDILTGLPNRYKLNNDLDELIDKLKKEDNEFYLLFLDMDKFKSINDQMGHQTGDGLLLRYGAILSSNELTRDKSYRYGGDEFIVFGEGGDRKQLSKLVSFLLRELKCSFTLEQGKIESGVSIGISHFPYDSQKTSELLRQADRAMYHAKEKGGGCAYIYNRGNICTLNEYLN